MSLSTWLSSLLTLTGVWSLVTMSVSVAGLWLGGIEPRWSWWWGIGAQAVWLIAGIATSRPGDVILSVTFTIMYVRNLRRNRGASYRDQAAIARENRRLTEENADLRARCGAEPDPAGVW